MGYQAMQRWTIPKCQIVKKKREKWTWSGWGFGAGRSRWEKALKQKKSSDEVQQAHHYGGAPERQSGPPLLLSLHSYSFVVLVIHIYGTKCVSVFVYTVSSELIKTNHRARHGYDFKSVSTLMTIRLILLPVNNLGYLQVCVACCYGDVGNKQTKLDMTSLILLQTRVKLPSVSVNKSLESEILSYIST